jgi:hypothetical protein
MPTMATRFVPCVEILAANVPAEFHSNGTTFDLAMVSRTSKARALKFYAYGPVNGDATHVTHAKL